MDDLDKLAEDIRQAAAAAPERAAPIVAQHTLQAAAELRSGAPSRRVRASVQARFAESGLEGTALPTHPLSHLIAYGTGPRVQRTTGRFTGVMPANDFITPVRDRAESGFVRDMISRFGDL